MKTYLVGGAVRDLLMGLEPKDKDYVVVGSSIEEMTKLGFEMVGENFPIFLHPKTKEEYALARREKKTGKGYSAFLVEVDNVSLEDDLFRRYLTINAIALDEQTNTLIDPFNGQEDIKNKVLKHVSSCFAEDPLRVLRVARFQARYTNFTINQETKAMMIDLMEKEASSLMRERIYTEFNKAFKEKEDYLFFKVLNEVNFFKHYFKYDSIELHFNWNKLDQTQKWAYLVSKYPKFKTFPLRTEETSLTEKYLAFNAKLDTNYSNVWNFIKKLRLKSTKCENLTALLTHEQNDFLTLLHNVVDVYKKQDVSILSSLDKKQMSAKISEYQQSAYNEVLSGINK
jgi:tRNA nucleotidyltransferase (CCA-adding enzyme)